MIDYKKVDAVKKRLKLRKNCDLYVLRYNAIVARKKRLQKKLDLQKRI
jgi:hypothetical protein